MSHRYLYIFIFLFVVLDLFLVIISMLTTDMGLASIGLTVPFLMVYMTIGRWTIEMTSVFNWKVVRRLKCFTSATEGDLFPVGLYGSELSLQVEECILSISFLFAMIMRRNNASDEKVKRVAHEYFEKRFHASKQCRFRQTDETYLKSELERCLELPKLTDFRSPSLNVVKSKISYEARLELLDYLFQTAYASGKVQDATHDLLFEIAKFLLIKEWDWHTLEFRYECYRGKKQTEGLSSVNYHNLLLERSYQKLGLTPDASEADVKSAFREQVKNCHPDRVPENASQQVREEAVQLFRQTKEAYEMICKERGIR